MTRRILFTSLITAALLPLVAQAGPYVPQWGTRDRSTYDFRPYQERGTGVRLNADISIGDGGYYHDRDHWDDRGCPPGLAKKHNGCMPPGQAKKSWR